jgi:dTDP-4-dehydrorhamnose reductase
LDLEITINAYEGVSIDRSLDSSKLRKILSYEPPTWKEMIQRLSEEAGQYEEWRR